MVKKITAVLFLSFFIKLGAEAAMISVLVIETGLPQEGNKNQHSERWESNILDVFFDAGHIVSNAPILRLDARLDANPQGEIQNIASADINEARDTGSDYFIVAHLDYTPASQSPGKILLVLYSTTPIKKIADKQFAGKTYKSLKDEDDDLKKIIRELVPYLTQ